MAEVLEDKIQSLLEKRTELADRLANLEALKAETNARVYKKIKSDYEEQLSVVLTGISEQRGTLENSVDDLTARIEEKETLHTRLSDGVDELQIRARLREFDENDNDFQKELDDAVAERNTTADELDKLRSELADLNKVLRDVDDATSGAPARAAAAGGQKTAKAQEPIEELEELEIDEEPELVEEEGAAEESEGVACPSCNYVNPPQKLFCEECGAALDDDSEIDEEFDLIDDDLDL
jgi:DNA repair exonuclease SbcCD ATPase subunit